MAYARAQGGLMFRSLRNDLPPRRRWRGLLLVTVRGLRNMRANRSRKLGENRQGHSRCGIMRSGIMRSCLRTDFGFNGFDLDGIPSPRPRRRPESVQVEATTCRTPSAYPARGLFLCEPHSSADVQCCFRSFVAFATFNNRWVTHITGPIVAFRTSPQLPD
jgi:hypothetical protein